MGSNRGGPATKRRQKSQVKKSQEKKLRQKQKRRSPEWKAAFWLNMKGKEEFLVLGRPGSDLLSQVLRLSTIGAGEFNGRVRDGIGFRLPAITTRPAKNSAEDNKKSTHRDRYELSRTHVLSSAQAGRLVT